MALSQWPADCDRALVSIRPEKVLVSKARIDAENVFQARVAEEAKVRQAGFLAAEIGDDGRIGRLKHWTVTREHPAG